MATDSLLGPEGLAKGHDLGHASLGSVGVNDVAGWLDGLELGWFHKVHLARMVFAFTALATVQEVNSSQSAHFVRTCVLTIVSYLEHRAHRTCFRRWRQSTTCHRKG